MPRARRVANSAGNEKHSISNVLTAAFGSERIAVFDYELAGNHDNSEKTGFAHFETVYLVVSERLNLPYFQTQPETWLGDNALANYLKDKVGITDCDLSESASFSAKYILEGGGRDDLRRVFTKQVCDFYERHKLYRTIGDKKMLCIVHPQTELVERSQIMAQLHILQQLFQLVQPIARL